MGTSFNQVPNMMRGLPICATTHLDFRTKTTVRKYVMSFLHYFPKPICLKDSRFLSIVPRWTIWWTFSLVPKICTPRKIFFRLVFRQRCGWWYPLRMEELLKAAEMADPLLLFFCAAHWFAFVFAITEIEKVLCNVILKISRGWEKFSICLFWIKLQMHCT